jgi:hypothetical protein
MSRRFVTADNAILHTETKASHVVLPIVPWASASNHRD